MKAQLIIDGQEIEAESGQTILDACEANGIHVPKVCTHENVQPRNSSWMSVVDVRGMGLTPARTTAVGDGMVVDTRSDEVQGMRRQVLEGMLENHYGDCLAPCSEACPAKTDIQGYLYLIAQGRPDEAMELVRETNPIPSIIGRICPRPCEEACRRSLVDDSLAICWLKRYAADQSLLDGGKRPLPKMEPDNGIKVAIVGSGPAGLSAAYYLRKMGYQPTIFESLPHPGGMLRYGIPEYRLPKTSVLDKEIKTITDMGVDLRCNATFGKDVTFASLGEQGYKAFLLAVGCHESYDLDLPGENELEGVYLGTDFLREVTMGRELFVGDNVAVIGGGNTAMDACRTARRLGATKVTVVYRRSRAEMPASVWEIEEAEQEGVRFHFLAAPVGLKGDGGRLSAITCIRMELGEPDASGRRRPVPVAGSDFDIPVDSVISAIGQSPELSALLGEDNQLPGGQSVPVGRSGRITADPQTMGTEIPGVFSAGDSQRGAATAIEAVADGRLAASSIDQYLRTGQVRAAPEKFLFRKGEKLEDIDTAELDDVERKGKAHMFCLRPKERTTNFKEIEQGYDSHTAMDEARRCLECGCRAPDYCVLRDLADELEVEQPPRSESLTIVPADRSQVIERDPNKCIQCDLCEEVCRSVMSIGALGRRYDAGVPPQWLDHNLCVSCGHCIEVCPVGSIVQNTSIRPNREVSTICPYCGVGCKLDVQLRDDLIVRSRAAVDGPANLGSACVKGRFGFDFVNSPERLTTPLIRKNGELEPASWKEALDLIAARFREHKGKEFGLFASAKVTNEENYLMQKFARAVQGTNNVDHCARLCHASTVAGLANTLGSGAMTNSIAEIEKADCIFSIGSNTTKAHPVIGMGIKRAARAGTAQLIVANPKRIELCNYAAIYMQHRPGTDVPLIMGMLRHIFDSGLQNDAFIEARTEGFEDFRASLASFPLDEVSQITGVPADKIKAAAELYAGSETSSVVYSMGITQHTHGTENVFALANLALATGQIGRPNTGINPLRGQNNVQGACDMGALPNVYPGYQAVTVPETQEKFRKAWGLEQVDPDIGLTVTEMLGPKGKDIKALYIIGENPAMSEPDCIKFRQELQEIDFVVVQDIFLTETAQLADVVLPGVSFAEKDGTFTNTERRVQLLDVVVPPVKGAMEDWKILCKLARMLGAKGFNFRSSEQIMREIARLTPSYGGMAYDRLRGEGLHWPCLDDKHPGTPYLHKEAFPRPGGRATFKALEYRESEELPDADYPLMLTTGRSLYHFHTSTMSRRSPALVQAHPEERVQINPADAGKLGIEDGEMVRISSRRGSVSSRADVSHIVQPGLVFMTFHFVEACANELTNKALDPIAKIPEFKVCAVKVSKV